MLLIEKTVKLLDDFHFDIYREYVKNINIRSYYPLALLDVIDRDFNVEQDSEKLFRDVYGEAPEGEKDMKKFFQLGHHTFKMTSYLARNYPNYLHHNFTRIEHLINTGELEKAISLAEILQDVCEKVEDYDLELKVLSLLAHLESWQKSYKSSIKYYDRQAKLLKYKQDIHDLNYFAYNHLKGRGKESEQDLEKGLSYLATMHKSKSFTVQMMSRLNSCYMLYNNRHENFYSEATFKELNAINNELKKNDFVVIPYLHNLRPKVSFLKLNYAIRQMDFEKVLNETTQIIEESEDDLFWNSLINLPEFNAIGIQTSYYVTNYFTSYRDDHLEIIPDEIQTQIKFLLTRCKNILKNPLLQEKFIVKYINMSTICSGLLLLGGKEQVKESVEMLENLLLFFQQVAFHEAIDSIYTTLIMGCFCLKDFERVEKNYRRYKKSTKEKIVNPENDLALHGFYFASKYLESQRNQYVKKLIDVIEQTKEKPNLNTTHKMLLDVAKYFKFPIPVALFEK